MMDDKLIVELVNELHRWVVLRMPHASKQTVYATIGCALGAMAALQQQHELKEQIDGQHTPRHTQQ